MSTSHGTVRKQRIVLTAVGSLGDLHPYIALALGLRERGHDSVIATSAHYRQKVEALGLRFHPIRPDSTFVTDPAVMGRMMDSRWGTVRVGREIIVPAMRETFEDISSAAVGADLLVSHPLMACATRLVSEMTRVPWASTMITPLGFFSAYDFPIIPVCPAACRTIRLMGPALASPIIGLAKRATRFLAEPWYRLRKELGLPRAPDANPLLDSHSPRRVLALFSPLLAPPKPDWPAHTIITGFPVFDHDGSTGMPPALTDFLNAGPPPIVFTLGCSAAVIGEAFFRTSATVAERLGKRAVLIVGRDCGDLCASLPGGIAAFEYAPFSDLFPRAAAIVHAGGIGTTGLAMRAGCPCLVIPYAHDQLDNATRLVRLGLARTLSRHRYTPARASAELRQLLEDDGYACRASDVRRQMQHEDGVRAACNALEALFADENPCQRDQPP